MDIRKMLSGESKNVEFKERRPENSDRYMKTVVAFANGKGGSILGSATIGKSSAFRMTSFFGKWMP